MRQWIRSVMIVIVCLGFLVGNGFHRELYKLTQTVSHQSIQPNAKYDAKGGGANKIIIIEKPDSSWLDNIDRVIGWISAAGGAYGWWSNRRKIKNPAQQESD